MTTNKHLIEPLTLLQKFIFAVPAFFGALTAAFFNVNYFIYYTNTLDDSLANVNFAYTIDMIFLVLSFPVFGWILDNTQTRWGRRKPFLVVAPPLLFAGITILWFPVEETSEFESLWFAGCNIIIVTFTFLVLTPYSSLGVEITPDYNERSQLFGLVQAFYMLGFIVGVSVPPMLTGAFPNTKMVYLGVSLVNGTLGLLAFALMVYYIPEPKQEQAAVSEPSIPIISGIRFAMLYNRPFILLLISISAVNSAPYTISLLPYWCEATLGLSSTWEGTLLLCLVASGFLFLPVWYLISKHLNKILAFQIMLYVGSVGFFLLIFPAVVFGGYKDDVTTKILAVFVCLFLGSSGINMTFNNFLYLSLQGDVIDYDELLTGLRREGQYVNLMQYLNWFGSIMSITVPFAIIDGLGYISASNATASEQPESARIGIALITGPLTGAIILAGSMAMYFYPITETVYKNILECISAHKKGETVTDPVSGMVLAPHFDPMQVSDIDGVDASLLLTPSEQKSSPLFSRDDFILRWELFHFSHWELRLAKKLSGPRTLILVNIVELVLWSLPLIGSIVTWSLYPPFGDYAPYLIILAISMFFYFAMCTASAVRLERRGLTNAEIDTHLAFGLAPLTHDSEKMRST
eukprot:TRINITY_DN13128_c0_g1_i1.p1 TRINITY_DN13128_c0_g1~~TRINITY_DN13128_c0_g1_i1.p1  ORF type:complete len:634 (-),score=80.44 TRINITY_DN13128_c0_g1_i1:78-1979(-)